MIKRNLSFAQLFNLSFGFFGVQIAYALQSANISRIFATLGADPHTLSFFWILPPLMGMIVQPLVGKYSDKTWNRLGRRKPYLLVGALIALAVCAVSDPVASQAMEALNDLAGSEAHATVILARADENTLSKLKINLTCEPKYETHKLYHG